MFVDVACHLAKDPKRGLFTYFSDKSLAPGTIVSVPFGKQTTQGVVITTKKESTVRGILPILRVLSPKPLLTNQQIALLEDVAAYYHASLSATVSLVVPTFTASAVKEFAAATTIPRSRQDQTLIIAPTQYLFTKLCEKLRKQGKQFLAYSGDALPKDKVSAYLTALTTTPKIVVATKVGLFLPFSALKQIYLYEEHDWAYKEARLPRYHASLVAQLLAKQTDASIEIRDNTPRIQTWYRARTLSTITIKPSISLANRKTIQFIDITQERKASNYSLISEELAEALKVSLKRKQSVLLYLNKKNDGGMVFCRHCTQTSFSAEQVTTCPNCKSDRVRFDVINLKQVAADINKLLILWGVPPLEWQVDSAGSMIKLLYNDKPLITIATQKILYTAHYKSFPLIGVILVDTTLDLPEFRSTEKTYSQLSQLAALLAEDGRYLVQTKQQDHKLFPYFIKQDFTGFAKNELTDRKTLGYPPFTLLVLLSFAAKTQATATKHGQQLCALLEKINDQAQGNQEAIEIVGPFTRLHDANETRILLKATKRGYLEPFLETVPSSWKIEFDPENILL